MNLAEHLLISLSDVIETPDATYTSWHKIFPHGVFHHPVYGKLDFREPFFQTVKQNFDSRVRKIEPFIDFRHENGEAAGWIKELEIRPGDGMFAKIEWTDIGYNAVKRQHFRYFSPEFGKYTSESTKQTFDNVLNAVALTNIPFLKDLPDVRLEEFIALSEEEYEDEEEENTELADDEEDDDEGEDKDKPQDKNKKRPVKPRGNQGAPQPSMPRGAKPHINRSRQPDPTGEMAAMADKTVETTALETPIVDGVSMAEFRELTARLEEQAKTAQAEAAKLTEEVKTLRLETLKRDIEDEVRSLSEPRTTTADSGEGETATVRCGIPSVVSDMYKTFALENPAGRTPVLAMLQKIAEVGTVSLEAKGTGTFNAERDPEHKAGTQVYASGYSDDLLKLAETYARANNLDWNKLSDRELAVIRVAPKSSR